jgi:hypothetical protein
MPLRQILRLAFLCLAILAISGCGKSSNNSGGAQVRFMNALVDGGAINVTIGSNSSATGLAFEGLTTYQNVDSGSQEFKVSVAGGTSTIIDTTISINNSTYTYLVYGTASAPAALLLSDTISTTPASGLFGLRVINAAFGTASLDVYVTSPGASLDTASPNLSNILVSAASAFVQLAPGSLQVRLTLHNSKQVIYDTGTQTFANQASYQIVAYTKGSGTLVNGALLNLDSTGTGSVVNSGIAQFKLIHAAPGTAGINAFVDGTNVFANVPYQGASSYAQLTAVTHTVTIESVTAPGAPIAAVTSPFAPATDTSVVVTGTPGAQTAIALADNNLPGTTGTVRVRFVNVATDVGAVDVLVNFAKKVSNLPARAPSDYVPLVFDTYAINFDLAGTTTLVLSLPAVALTTGQSYTLYLVGSTGAYAGVLTRDD